MMRKAFKSRSPVSRRCLLSCIVIAFAFAAVPIQCFSVTPSKGRLSTSVVGSNSVSNIIISSSNNKRRNLTPFRVNKSASFLQDDGNPLSTKSHRTSTALQAAATKAVQSSSPTSHQDHLTLAGRIMPFLSNFALTPEKTTSITAALTKAVDIKEFIIIGLLGWGIVPFTRFIHSTWNQVVEEQSPSDVVVSATKTFEESLLYKTSLLLSQAFKIGTVIYAIDCLAIVLSCLGFQYIQRVDVPRKVAKFTYTIWAALRIKHLKQYLLGKAFKKKPEKLGKVQYLDRILNGFIFIITSIIIIDFLKVDFGMALSSIFAFGGVGTLVFSLASRDLAAELVSGLVLSTSERFFVGDEVKLGDGTWGLITRIGLLSTDVRGGDEIVTRIPNSQIVNQRTSNISRMRQCQVTQELWFNYEDIMKIPRIIKEIKKEILASCPHLITDGSRPFRVHWREFKDDHLEVVVDCRFRIPPTGDIYFDNREKVLEAIARAVNRLGVQFALPSYFEISKPATGATSSSSTSASQVA